MRPRIHYSGAPLVLDRDRAYEQAVGFKPHGLWYSVGDSWREWCLGESFRLDRLRFETPLWLNTFAAPNGPEILTISNHSELRRFTTEYGGGEYGNARWADVAERWAGIEISPYMWEYRMDLLWYYAWDCASGCIWDLAAVSTGISEEVAA